MREEGLMNAFEQEYKISWITWLAKKKQGIAFKNVQWLGKRKTFKDLY